MDEISGWAYTQCIREIKCPKCKSVPNQKCKTPKNKIYHQPHLERSKLYLETIGKIEFKRRHGKQ